MKKSPKKQNKIMTEREYIDKFWPRSVRRRIVRLAWMAGLIFH